MARTTRANRGFAARAARRRASALTQTARGTRSHEKPRRVE
jgi:hypothetical protein